MADTNLSVLQRLRAMSNMTGAGPVQTDMASGMDTYAPTEGELLRQQLTPGQGSFGGPTAENPNASGVTLSRDMLREAGLADFRRRLRALSDQYIVPEQVKGMADLQKQQMANAGNLMTEQVKGEAAAKTAAVPRTVNQSITTSQGAGAGQGNSYTEDLSQRALDQVNKIMPLVNNWSAGAGSTLSFLPMSSARQLKSELEALKSDIGFKALNEMRAASKTGGALGQVSDIEERLLSQSLGGLDQANSPAVLRQQLANIQAGLQRWEKAKQQYGAGGEFVPGLGYSINVGGGDTGGGDPYGLFGGQ